MGRGRDEGWWGREEERQCDGREGGREGDGGGQRVRKHTSRRKRLGVREENEEQEKSWSDGVKAWWRKGARGGCVEGGDETGVTQQAAHIKNTRQNPHKYPVRNELKD